MLQNFLRKDIFVHYHPINIMLQKILDEDISKIVLYASASLPTNTNGPIWSMSIEIHSIHKILTRKAASFDLEDYKSAKITKISFLKKLCSSALFLVFPGLEQPLRNIDPPSNSLSAC